VSGDAGEEASAPLHSPSNPAFDILRIALEASRGPKETALPPREEDLSPITQRKNKAAILETWLAQMAQVDNAPTAGTKEEGIVESDFAIFQRATNENLTGAEADESFVTSRFKGRDVPNAHDPGPQIVGQENKIIWTEDPRRPRPRCFRRTAATGPTVMYCNDNQSVIPWLFSAQSGVSLRIVSGVSGMVPFLDGEVFPCITHETFDTPPKFWRRSDLWELLGSLMGTGTTPMRSGSNSYPKRGIR
jgi:hypothetical protein